VEAEDPLDVVAGGVHEVAAAAAVDVEIDEARRDVASAGVDRLGSGGRRAARAGLLDPPLADHHRAVANLARIRDQGAIEEILEWVPHE